MISVRKQKELVIPVVKELLEARGFENEIKDEDLFLKRSNRKIIKIHFYFSNLGLSGSTLFSVTFKEIEDIIFEIGLPNNPTIQVNDKYKILSTIYDNENSSYSFTNRPRKLSNVTISKRSKVINVEDIQIWINEFKRYITEDGNTFLNQYSSISDLNTELNNIEKNGEKNYSRLLLGGIDHLFRALIISKLCNDPNHLERQERFDKIILQPKYEKWQPYYQKLKEKLEDTAPIYNNDNI